VRAQGLSAMRVSSASSTPPALTAAACAVVLLVALRSDVSLAAASINDAGLSPMMPMPPPLAALVPTANPPSPATATPPAALSRKLLRPP
ncbi:hypothetical protein E2562_032856, partial [Oryza meyeriana var. granulata]